MKPRDLIAERREELGLSQAELDEKLGFPELTLRDVEWHDGELESVLDIREVRLLANFLKIPLLILLSEFCPICKQQCGDVEYTIDVPQLVKSRREEKGLSKSELGDLVGVYDAAIEKIEKTPEGIGELNIVMLKDLVKALDMPILTLLGRKCIHCK
jgi:ribosome-binding protein aMBF1 (putative translation factor)